MHALIIEDESIIAWAIEAALRRHGFTSFDFANTEERAIEAALSRCPDLITADVRIDDGSGVVAVERICADRPVPVIYVTGNPEALLGIAAAIVVAKPFTDDQFESAIAQAFGRA